MELTSFNPTNCKQVSALMRIALVRQNGQVRFSAQIRKRLKLEPGVKVEFFQNEEGTWFLEVNPDGFPLKVTSGTVAINNTVLVEVIFDSFDCTAAQAYLNVSEEPTLVDGRTLYEVVEFEIVEQEEDED